jgi:hypothetical protein
MKIVDEKETIPPKVAKIVGELKPPEKQVSRKWLQSKYQKSF